MGRLKQFEEVRRHRYCSKDTTPSLLEALNDYNSGLGVDMLGCQREDL